MTDVAVIMDESVPEISPDAPASRAAGRLQAESVPGLVVVDDAARVVGLVTEADLIAVLVDHDGDPPVRAVMSPRPLTTTPDESVDTAATLLAESEYDLLPVVRAGRAAGLVTADCLGDTAHDRLAVARTNGTAAVPASGPTTPSPVDRSE